MEGDLSAYLLAPAGSTDFVALDAGTLLTGLRQARMAGSFYDIALPADSALSLEGHVLRHHIKAYLISHAHLDHLAGLVINSTDDTRKDILALASTIDPIRDNVFNWRIWPNFGDEGPDPHLKKYRFVRLTPGEAYAIEGTLMAVVPFELCHSEMTSTAFLIRSGDSYILYVGDTGSDEVERCDRLKHLWQYVAPLVREGELCGVFLEVSYPDPLDIGQLYGHLTPMWMMKELRRLAVLVDPERPAEALRGMTVVATHIKPALNREVPSRDRIKEQLEALNDLGIHFVFPRQGDRIEF